MKNTGVGSPELTFEKSAGTSRLRGAAPLAVASLLAAVSVAGCAAAGPYNPAGLNDADLSRVDGVCQSVMGLQPSEPPIPGPGDPRLTYGENHYQGCVASLSDSLRDLGGSQDLARADQTCRATGLPGGSAALAECVLNAGLRGTSEAAMAPILVLESGEAVRRGSFYTARPPRVSHRIETACADLGLNPVGAAFDNCVKDMKDTFFAIDNPQN